MWPTTPRPPALLAGRALVRRASGDMAGSQRTACPLARPYGGTSVSDDARRARSSAPGQRSDQQSAKESARALSTLPHAARSAAPFGAALDHLPPAAGSGRSLPRPVPGTKWMRWPTYDRKLKGVAVARSSGGRRLGRLRRGQRRFGGRQRSGRSHCHNVVSQPASRRHHGLSVNRSARPRHSSRSRLRSSKARRSSSWLILTSPRSC